ncbi:MULTISPECIES: flagellar motor protein MotB [unclassified Actinotalea]|uniref:flagellar motor protein MotB n=1 Tax=unclassified Actinotalea TaxID=2638618 RepID=UPI0015F66D22|nr:MULTISPECIES: flagellar motor protein MotB [unclassified Actinotalea]
MSAGHGSGGHGRKSRVVHEEEHENHERWAVSYADMMTVLVGLFIVLYAISQVDQVKFEQLRQSLASGFGQPAPVALEGSTGPLTGVEAIQITPDLRSEAGVEAEQIAAPSPEIAEAEARSQAATTEYQRLDAIADQISAALTPAGLADRVRFRVTERGLVIGMVADDVFFRAASAELTDTARRIVDTTAPVLASIPDEISVEGHTNDIPVSGRYPTNWELSSDRATQVLRRLVEAGGVAPQRIAAVGFGEARPMAEPGEDPLEANRRVDLVVLSSVPEDVRALLPSIAAAQQG